MLKRIVLTLAFVAALGVGGLGLSSTALAWHGCDHYGYGYAAYAPASYYGYGFGPRVSYPTYGYYPVAYRTSYGYGHRHHRHHHHHDHHDHGGLRVSFGF